MAYPAVVSLKQTIHHLLISPHISILSPTRQTLQDAHKHLTSIQQSLTRSIDINCGSEKRNKLNTLDSQIREAAHQLQDSLESHTSNLFLSIQHHISSPLKIDLHHEITSFTETAKELEKNYIEELEIPNSEEENSAEIVTNSAVKMVGMSDAIADMKEHLLRITRPDYFGVYVFFGGAGNGRSIVARGVYDAVCRGGDTHPLKQMFLDVIARIRGRRSIYWHYDKNTMCGARVKIGATYQLKQVLVNIIAQINCTTSVAEKDGLSSTEQKNLVSEVELGQHLAASLKGRRYIIALDDVRDTEVLARLRRWLPEQNNGSIVLVTTGVVEVAEFDDSFFRFEIPVVLNEAISWRCIKGLIESRGWVVTTAFEEAGKKIADNCRGYRIVVAKVMVALLRSEKSLNLWNKLAADKDDPIFKVDDEILEASEIKKGLHEENVRECDFLFDVSILINRVKRNLYPKRFFSPMGIMAIYGMAGIGKTTLIRNIFEDSSILGSFDHHVWINIGQKYQSKEILVDILHQIYPHIDRRLIKEGEKLVKNLCAQLSDKKCLIVLDDLWRQEPVHFLKKSIPNIKGELVVTTRMLKVGFFGPCDMAYKLRLLNKEESWDLLREKVFVEERCPSQLEKIGKKIAENCEGLPLLILAVADFLSKSEKTLEQWNKVAEKNNQNVMNAQIEISKGLLPSYEALPQQLKVCFLYMGVFPRNHEIPTSTLMKLWFADGFIEPIFSQTTKDFASNCLKELDQSSMVMVKKGSDLESNKSCNLHSVYWHLSCNIARESKFFHAMDNYLDKSTKSLNDQRRLCIRKSILLGIKDVYNTVASASASASRALLCTGPPHPYPVPLCFGSRLLTIIEALGIRLYDFPDEVVKQIHLSN
ncbi:uncharacterized protein LOC121807947 isoform X2 [Salvia splendens]|uniref:uncharacterized protein LOC121807947 isoform X2 n=1 Tax=Salvia splendens TaxID=180675 RepID=UPI001C269648|nr:uncharacterized protein LOC121807947 isoform X2 [Salvia splendens]